MKGIKLTAFCAAAMVAGASSNALAKVSEDEAKRLLDGGDLTPLGGEKKGNGGAIPAWDGGYFDKNHKNGDRYKDPFASDKPEFTITKDNMDQYKDKLSAGQIAMLTKYDTFKIPVYKTRRTAAAPDFVYKATYNNALNAELANDGEAVVNAVTGIPFPIPQSGKEPIWNHKTRYRGLAVTRYNNQAAVTTSGAFSLFKLKEDVKFNYSYPDQTTADLDNILVYFLQITEAPPRQAGGILLVHDTLDQVKEARRAWLYNPGQRRLRRAPNVAYDNPGTGADGLRVNDQLDTFNGALDRYNWKLVGKREMYVPYNAGKIHQAEYKYKDILKPNHVNMDLTRYELHRVWEVDSNLKEGTSHTYKRRTFYIDEDSWSIVLVDIYDKRDQLWRVHESHIASAYDLPAMAPTISMVYDLQSSRYLTMDMNNEDDETTQKEFGKKYFSTSNVKKLAKK